MAKAFQFRLAAVETIRRRAQTLQRRSVAEAVRAEANVRERIDHLNADMRGSMAATVSTRQRGVVDVELLRLAHYRRGWLERRIEELDSELTRLSAVSAAQRAKLAETTKRLRVIEKLRQRQWDRHLLEERKQERAVMDEAAGQLYLRKRTARRNDMRCAS
jgi:flagellar export protein FliJ